MSTKIQVFLGGSCNPTTWRAQVAMPAFDKHGVSYYNPQVDDWHEGLVALEAKAKAEAETLLFVIDSETRAVASILEATEYIATGRKVVLVINEIPDGQKIDDDAITGRQLKDLNRARSYLADLAQRHEVPVYESVEAAVDAIIG